MGCVRLTMAASYRKAVAHHLQTAQHRGHLRQVTSLLAILAGHGWAELRAGRVGLARACETVATWVGVFCGYRGQGAPRQTPTGHPPTLTPTQPEARATLIDEGPVKAGCRGAGWRSPLIQQSICDRFGGFSHGCYIAQLLKNLGFGLQKAACVSAHLKEETRQAWRTTTWLQRLRVAPTKKAWLLFGDAASFPPWEPLTYTWARRGQHPKGKTSGKRTGYKVFGLLASCTGCFLYPGQAGRLTSPAYLAFLTRVLKQTTPPILLRQDGAKYHTSAEPHALFTQPTSRLQVFQLPTYVPAYNPIEKLWKQIKPQATPLHDCPTFEALTEKVEQARLKFANAPEEWLALCGLPTELAQVA
jgi:transposase